ncbi:MAG: hypothetical protein LBC47_01695 [Tannerella sp.]|jgi:hypothetical protein|nr:hypothetical protein [Tannerella sp.]
MKRISKDFDCIQMKNDIQAKIYAETKDMNFEEYKAYLENRLKNSNLFARMQRRKTGFLQVHKIRLPE